MSEQIDKWGKRLERVLKDAPAGVWLFAASGNLHVMKLGDDGKPIMRGTTQTKGYDPEGSLFTVKCKCPIDGGDW